MSRRLLTCCLPVLLLALGVSATAPVAHAQDDPADWHTVAGGDEILALALDPAEPGVLWAGTEGGGLVRWQTDGGEVRQWLFPNDPGLAGNVVRDLAFDGDGGLWLALPGRASAAWRPMGPGGGLGPRMGCRPAWT